MINNGVTVSVSIEDLSSERPYFRANFDFI